jgi:hypothetical protein
MVDEILRRAYNRGSGAKGRLPAKEALTLQMHIQINVIIAMFRLTSAGRR